MFCQFRHCQFYPSIKHEHLTESIKFAKNYTEIANKDIKLIEHTCKTIITYDKKNLDKKMKITNMMYQWVHSSVQSFAT